MSRPTVAKQRAALYARVSSQQQADENTIASQVAALKARVKADGLGLDRELCFLDAGASGATLLRPALERLRDQAAAGAFDRLYVHSPDRLACNYAHQMLLVEELQRAGVELVFLNHDLGRSPEEKLLLQVQGMMAEYERAKILERSRRGKRHAAQSGSPSVLSGAPYGYRYISKFAGGGQARYEVIEEQARVVRQIFRWVGQERCSLGAVCRRLKQQQIPSPTGKPSWDRTTVWALLQNPAYRGEAHFGKTCVGPARPRLRPLRGAKGPTPKAQATYDTRAEEQIAIAVPALVDADLFATVAAQLAENRQRSREGERGAKYLLQGLVVCAHCGYAYYGKPVSRAAGKGKQRHYAYYRCTGTDAYRFGGERVCANPQCRTDRLDEAVWNDVAALLADPERLRQEYQRRLQRGRNQSTRASEALDKLLAKVRRGIARLIDAYADGLLDKEEFEPRLRGAKERLAQLEAEAKTTAAKEAQEQALQAAIDQLQTFAQKITTGLSEADWELRREILRALVKQVEIGPETVRIVYKVQPLPFDPGPKRGCLQDCGRGDNSPLRGPFRGGEQDLLLQVTGFQPSAQDAFVHEDVIEQPAMVDTIEAGSDVAFEDPIGTVAATALRPPKHFVTFIQGIRTAPFQPKAIGVAIGQGFGDGVEAEQVQGLHGTIGHRRNA